MVRIRHLRSVCVLLVVCPAAVHGQAAPHEVFVVCGSQPSAPTVYFSGVMQGPASAFQGFRNGFGTFLSQTYGYKGAVGCAPANTAVNAQGTLNARAAALRNQKKNVVETGWTESAAVAASAALPPTPAAKQAGSAAGRASAGSGGAAASGSSELSGILGAVLGAGGGTGGTGAAAGGAAHAKASAGTTGGSADQGGATQVASALATVFSNKSSGGTSGTASTPGPEPSEGLGSAQAQNTKLVLYGCGRQDTRVACVTELTNQNQKDTLVQSAAIWNDTFIVDDRGDRHPRSNGFFLNIDGDQRSQLDISYGKTARFILMFDGVPAKVQTIALRSSAGGLDVENISLVPPATDAQKH